jgi:hypothetical protein
MIKHRHIAALALCATAVAACGDNGQTDITAPAPTSAVMYFNFGLGAPGVNFFANDAKVTGVSSSTGAESPVGTSNGVAAGGYYVGIAPGQYTLSGRLSDTTAANHNVQISSVSTTLADGKWYSYYQAGPYDATAKHVDAFVVEDDIPAGIDYATAHVRLVNAIYNSNPGTLTVTNNDTTGNSVVIGGAVPYKSASAFVAVPPGTYNLSVAGLGATPVVRNGSNAVLLDSGRYYTITAKGDITVTSSKAANYPSLDYQPNR